MSQKPRRTFTDEQKSKVVKIVEQSEKLIGQLAREMGLTESALRKWVKQAKIDRQGGGKGQLTSKKREELNKLRRDLKKVQMERDFLKKGGDLLCQRKLGAYELIHAEKENYPINLMCRVLKQSRSGYAWCKRPTSPREKENELLYKKIQQIHQDSRQT